MTADLREIADGIVAVGLTQGGKPGRALDEAYDNLRLAVRSAYPEKGNGDVTLLTSLIGRGLTPTVVTDYERWKPLHWVIEAPDVIVDRGGFDAIVGNPPFLGGKKVSGAMSTEVREWLVNQIACGTKGNADLVAYFFLRATSLLHTEGTLGLVATNTVAQGDTREVGLDAMAAAGFTITRAIQSRSWPASSANLEYAAVWGTVETVSQNLPRVADDIEVRCISTLLEPAGRVAGLPSRLAENGSVAHIGCLVLGMGFTIRPELAAAWVEDEPRVKEVVFPYLNGEDLNQRPDSSASRWIVDFADRPLEVSKTYVHPFDHVVENVRPERVKGPRKAYRDRWWQFAEKQMSMRRAIAQLPEVLVIALVSKTVMPMRVPTGQIFSHALGVFATDDYGDQAVLSSNLHQLWAITYGSGMRNDPRYTPSDVFETFPRPAQQ